MKVRYEKGNFAVVPNVDEAMTLSEVGFKVYIALCKYADEHGGCFPSIETIREFTLLSDGGTKKGLREIRDKGFVEITKRKRPNGSAASNYYQILIVASQQVGGTDVPHPGAQTCPPLTIPIEQSLLRKGGKATEAPKEENEILKELYKTFKFYSLVIENHKHVPGMADKLREALGKTVATEYLKRLQQRDLRIERKTQEFVPQLRNWRDVVGKSAQIIDYYTRTRTRAEKYYDPAVYGENFVPPEEVKLDADGRDPREYS